MMRGVRSVGAVRRMTSQQHAPSYVHLRTGSDDYSLTLNWSACEGLCYRRISLRLNYCHLEEVQRKEAHLKRAEL